MQSSDPSIKPEDLEVVEVLRDAGRVKPNVRVRNRLLIHEIWPSRLVKQRRD